MTYSKSPASGLSAGSLFRMHAPDRPLRRGAQGVAVALLLGASAACSDSEPNGPSEGAADDASTVRRDAGGRADAGRSSVRSDAASSSGSMASGNGSGGNGTTCAKAELKTTRIIPTVWMLVDGSGSMGSPLNGVTGASRWQVLRDALLAAPDGLIAGLQASIDFGLFVYDGGLSPPGVKTDACPRTIEVAPALNNLAAITSAYPAAQTGASTPTHYALESISARIAAAASTDPTFVVLATDGRPNLCDFHDGVPSTGPFEQEAVDTVAALAAKGTKVFAISLAGNDPDTVAHLNAVAAAGNTGKPAFSPNTQADLVAALTEIIGGTTSCDVHVEGTIVAGRECAGDVLLNGTPLVCNDPDGFRIGDDHQTLQLLGGACDALRGQPTSELSASFSCDDVIVI